VGGGRAADAAGAEEPARSPLDGPLVAGCRQLRHARLRSNGYSLAHGCIRMVIPQAEWLFDHVEVGTTVSIGAS
jgi:hypothetical protein